MCVGWPYTKLFDWIINYVGGRSKGKDDKDLLLVQGIFNLSKRRVVLRKEQKACK